MSMATKILPVAILLVAACGGDARSPSPVRERGTGGEELASEESGMAPRIVFFGTSLTAGLGVDQEEAYPALIQQRFDSMGLSVTVVNAGISGETSAAGLRRIDWILRQPVSVLVLELGANDALRGLELKAAKENLQEIINRTRAKYPEVRIVVAGMQAPPNLGRRYTEEFSQMFVDLARANGAALVPFLLEGVGGHAELNQPDGIHPNERGHQIVANNVWKVLEPIVRAR